MSEVLGLDVSRWQNYPDNPVGINWALARQKGIVFGAARATVGDYYTDPTFRPNWVKMLAAGIYRTAYHVVRPDKPSRAQIDRLFHVLGDERGDLPLVLDVEITGGESSSRINENVKQCANWIHQEDGRWPFIYTGNWFMPNLGSNEDKKYLAFYKLWVAQYNDETAPDPVYPWNTNWTFWQFSADGNGRGAEFGADSKAIDINRYNGTLDDFKAEFNLEEQEQPPEPDPEPEPDLSDMSSRELLEGIYKGAKNQGWDLE